MFPTPRRPRAGSASGATALVKPPFVMQKRDEAIVRLVSEFRVISSDDLRCSCPDRTKAFSAAFSGFSITDTSIDHAVSVSAATPLWFTPSVSAAPN